MPKITKRLQIYTLHILFFAICISKLSIDLYLNKQLLEIISWLVCCYCSQLLLVYIFSFLIFMNLEVFILSHQPSYLINMTYIELLIVDISCLENLIPFLFPALNPCFFLLSNLFLSKGSWDIFYIKGYYHDAPILN